MCSFKERGGRNSLMLLSPEAKTKGVITASAGNHALALAWHGKDLGKFAHYMIYIFDLICNDMHRYSGHLRNASDGTID